MSDDHEACTAIVYPRSPDAEPTICGERPMPGSPHCEDHQPEIVAKHARANVRLAAQQVIRNGNLLPTADLEQLTNALKVVWAARAGEKRIVNLQAKAPPEPPGNAEPAPRQKPLERPPPAPRHPLPIEPGIAMPTRRYGTRASNGPARCWDGASGSSTSVDVAATVKAMQVGDSVRCPEGIRGGALASACSNWARRIGITISARATAEGLRIWRVA